MYEVQGSKLINDLGEGLVADMQQRLQLKLKNKPQPDGTYNDADVYKLGDNGSGYVVLSRGSDVLYFVRYEKVNHNSLPLGRQVLVWRNSADVATTDFAMTMFFDYLLPKFTALVSDKLQTRNGMGFWQHAIKQALQENLHVYFLDQRSTPNRLIRIADSKELLRYGPEIWGRDEGHKRTFAVISLKPLSLKGKS